MDKENTKRYILTAVDKDGFEIKREYFSETGKMYIEPKGYVKMVISEEMSLFMEMMCDIVIYPHNKVYVINNQKFTKTPYIEENGKNRSKFQNI